MHLHVDGRAVYAATGGRRFDARLPVVVLVHGAGFDHTIWTAQSRHLAHSGFSVVAVDLPGHGRSEGPALDSIPKMGDWIVGVLDVLEVSSAVVVGHSMGGYVAVETAAHHAGRVDGIALLGVANQMPVNPDLLAAAAANDPRAAELIADWSLSTSPHAARRHPRARLLDIARKALHRAPPGVLSTDLLACNAHGSVVPAAGGVTCPAVVVAGSDDKMTRLKGAQILAEAMSPASLVVIDGAGHLMMSEFPDRVDTILEAFCKQHAPPRAVN